MIKTYIPAAVAPGREGLELSLTRLDGPGPERLLLAVGSGSAVLELGPQKGKFVVSYGDASLHALGGAAGRAFADEVARWLGLELVAATAPVPAASPHGELSCSWARLGEDEDPFGTRWEAFKLFLAMGDLQAEVFLRLAKEGHRGQLVEKWSEYRRDLVDVLERALSDAPPRHVRPREGPETGPGAELLFSAGGALEFAIPNGWLLTRRPEGHFRLADPEDEMMIEVSYLRLPPLPPDAPDVTARLQAVIDGSERGASASAIVTLEQGDAAIAWSEYAFDSRDTKRPEAAHRPARGRWLIASNVWVQALVTGCWWEADVGVARRAWDGVIASLRLGGRVTPEPAPAVGTT